VKLKCRPADFQVRELLDESYLDASGEHQLYEVSKRKLTSDEAARILAREARVQPRSVHLAGLKDRQAVTVQYMSVEGGHLVHYEDENLTIAPIGRGREPYTSQHSHGNGFEITVRDLAPPEIDAARSEIVGVRATGLPNYFDDQRFGNLRHDQGWVCLELMRGKLEHALGSMICAPSPHDDARVGQLKDSLTRAWGDWAACLRIARRTGEHQGVFEALVAEPGDWIGALLRVPLRVRLIHLYAWQSHLWNRAVSGWLERDGSPSARLALDSVDGPLWCWRGGWPEGVTADTSFRLPGQGLEDVVDERQRQLYEDALAEHRMVGSHFRIDGLRGFQPKGEDRPLVLLPRKLRAKPPSRDTLHPGRYCLRFSFELPRAAYATLVVKRLFVGSTPQQRNAHWSSNRQSREIQGDPRQASTPQRRLYKPLGVKPTSAQPPSAKSRPVESRAPTEARGAAARSTGARGAGTRGNAARGSDARGAGPRGSGARRTKAPNSRGKGPRGAGGQGQD
jgi:tRNA pseudouridine13 synthase